MAENYLSMTDSQLITFICQHAGDFVPQRIGTPSFREVADHGGIIERHQAGFAVIRPPWSHRSVDLKREYKNDFHILYFWIDPAYRRKQIGRAFLTGILTKHVRAGGMLACCHGSERVAFYESCGFTKELIFDPAVPSVVLRYRK